MNEVKSHCNNHPVVAVVLFLLPVYPVEPAKPAKYNPPAMRVRGVSYTKKITFPV